MKAFVFPGQGSQFPGMGSDLYKSNKKVKSLFKEADDVLGFALSNVMFEGSEEELKQTKITQPAIFLHSIAELIILEESHSPNAVAGHSLGEFSSLVANKTISFEDGLKLVFLRLFQILQLSLVLNYQTYRFYLTYFILHLLNKTISFF